MSKLIPITLFEKKAAQLSILLKEKLNKPVDKKTMKIANATTKPDPNLPPEETQYILKD